MGLDLKVNGPVSNQLISLTSREFKDDPEWLKVLPVSNQLISLTSREDY